MIILGVDIGTTGSKCVAFDEQAQQLSICYKEYPYTTAEMDLDPDVLRECVLGVIEGCAAGLEHPQEVGAIALSSFGESFVALDERGEPMGSIILYMANRCADLLEQYTEAFGLERFMHITRMKPDTMFSLPKIGWTIAQQSRRVWKFLQMEDYIGFVLSGETVTDYSLATRTLAFDLEQRSWCPEILALAGATPDQLPTPMPSGSIIGSIRPAMAQRLGLPGRVKVIIGAQDQVTAALGAGVLKPGDAVDGTGTVECITPVFENMIEDTELTRKNYVCIPYAAGGYATYAFNFSGGALVKWFRDTLAQGLVQQAKEMGISIYDVLNQGCPKEPTSLMVIPHFIGAGGTPNMVKQAVGTITGLTVGTGLYDIYRAVLEGLSYEMLINIETLAQFGINLGALKAAGGGAKSPAWLQIKADIFGRQVTPVLAQEAGASGSAMLAARALGMFSSLEEAAQVFVLSGQPYTPDPVRQRIYAEKFEEYKQLRSYTLGRVMG